MSHTTTEGTMIKPSGYRIIAITIVEKSYYS